MKSIQQLKSIEQKLVEKQSELRKVPVLEGKLRTEYRKNSADLSTVRNAIKLLERCNREEFFRKQANDIGEKITRRTSIWNDKLTELSKQQISKQLIAKEKKEFMAEMKMSALSRQLKFANFILQDV